MNQIVVFGNHVFWMIFWLVDGCWWFRISQIRIAIRVSWCKNVMTLLMGWWCSIRLDAFLTSWGFGGWMSSFRRVKAGASMSRLMFFWVFFWQFPNHKLILLDNLDTKLPSHAFLRRQGWTAESQRGDPHFEGLKLKSQRDVGMLNKWGIEPCAINLRTG